MGRVQLDNDEDKMLAFEIVLEDESTKDKLIKTPSKVTLSRNDQVTYLVGTLFTCPLTIATLALREWIVKKFVHFESMDQTSPSLAPARALAAYWLQLISPLGPLGRLHPNSIKNWPIHLALWTIASTPPIFGQLSFHNHRLWRERCEYLFFPFDF